MTSRLAAALALVCLGSLRLSAYTFTGSHWTRSPVTMQLQLGAPTAPLSDGSTTWGAVAEGALSTWNSYLGAMQFTVVRNSTAPQAEGNGYNNVFFTPSVYGQAWGTGVLAVTLTYTSGGSSTAECDVLFNNSLQWDSYRGALRYPVFDFRRVALHEFGHVVGLDHPDQAGQTVVAIMNSMIGNLDSLAADDISGGQALYGPNTSSAAVTAPAIATQPSSQTVTAGASVSFTVTASGSAPLSYQWAKAGVAISGATNATLTLNNVSPSAAGNYAATVSNAAGSATSNVATLTVNAPTPTVIAPSITTQPAGQIASAGTSASFSVVATGTAPLTYSWRKNGSAIPGATQATYTIAAVQPGNAGNYSVVVANSAGSVSSTSAPLTVASAPAITAAPIGQTVSAGDRVSLGVTATGTPVPSYQWQKNGANIAGATQSTFVISAAAPGDAGTYSVVVTNSGGSVTTVPVLVTVNYSQLVNLSTRGFIPTGGSLIAGFVLSGSTAKPLVIRAVGPALNSYGVTDPLADPNLALIAQGSSQTLAVNHSWSQTPSLSAAFQSVGAFPLPLGSADAASEMQLMPGAYTTMVTSNSGTDGGIALAEVYDADAAGPRTRLVNLSTLGFTGTGDNVLVAGFTVQGNATKHVLIRAIGPSLAPYGVTNYLVDPRLDVYPLGQSTSISGNDNWGGGAPLSSAFTAAGAFPLPAGSLDASVVLALQPGGYTVVVTGVGGSTGYALVEIYDLDP